MPRRQVINAQVSPKGALDTLSQFEVQQLSEAGLPAFDSGTVYRTLRQLEKAGMVSSFWDTSDSGPARRMYSLTKAGDIFLTSWIDVLGRYQAVLRKTIEGLDPNGAEADDEQGEPRPRRTRR